MSIKNPKRILLVDDDSDHLFLTKWMLERGNPELMIDIAESGEEGLQKLQETDFDCVISDFEMKEGMNGVDFLQSIANRKLKIPFIMMSSYNDTFIRQQAIQKGADDFITKSNGEEFINGVISSVERAIEKSQTNGCLGSTRGAVKHQVQLGEKRYFNFFEQFPDLCIFVSSDGLTIDEINDTTANVLGLDSSSLVGKSLTDLIDSADNKRLLRTLLELYTGANLTREFNFIDANGNKLLMSVSGTVIKLNGKVMGVLLCARPITHAKAI